MSDNLPISEDILKFFTSIANKSEAIWMVARDNNPTLTDDELLPIVREMYASYHLPQLRHVGVTFTDEQNARIRAALVAGDTPAAQRIILGELKKEENED